MPETTLLCQPISKNQNLNILETKWMSHRLESSIKDVGNYLKLWKTPAPSYLFLNKVLTAWHYNCLPPESQVTVTYCQITFLTITIPLLLFPASVAKYNRAAIPSVLFQWHQYMVIFTHLSHSSAALLAPDSAELSTQPTLKSTEVSR